METRTTTTDNDRVGLETTCAPLPNGSDGRDSHGRFCKGNRGGPGNPIAQQVSQIRRVLLSAVTEEDLVDIVQSLINKAKAGDTLAAREILDRLMGKAKVTMEIEPPPERTEQEIRTDLLMLLRKNPDVARELAKYAGLVPEQVQKQLAAAQSTGQISCHCHDTCPMG